MDWRKWVLRAPEQTKDEQLVEETEAYLAGRYLDMARPDTEGTPVWAQLNWIAHAPPGALLERAIGCGAPDRFIGTWAWAVKTLMRELVVLSGGDPQVVLALQRDCVIPVELTLMTPDCRDVLPADAASLVITRMRAHPRVRSEGRTRKLPPGVRWIGIGGPTLHPEPQHSDRRRR
jgi:hypothetical protein